MIAARPLSGFSIILSIPIHNFISPFVGEVTHEKKRRQIFTSKGPKQQTKKKARPNGK